MAACFCGTTSPPNTCAKQNARSLPTSTRRSTCVAFDDSTASVQREASLRTTSTMPGTIGGVYSSRSRSRNARLTSAARSPSRQSRSIEANTLPRNRSKYSSCRVMPRSNRSLIFADTAPAAPVVCRGVPPRSKIPAWAAGLAVVDGTELTEPDEIHALAVPRAAVTGPAQQRVVPDGAGPGLPREPREARALERPRAVLGDGDRQLDGSRVQVLAPRRATARLEPVQLAVLQHVPVRQRDRARRVRARLRGEVEQAVHHEVGAEGRVHRAPPRGLPPRPHSPAVIHCGHAVDRVGGAAQRQLALDVPGEVEVARVGVGPGEGHVALGGHRVLGG